jgi:uncharacterized protein YgbK (DUF1537 family)
MAFDTATRERTADDASAIVTAAATHIGLASACLAFLKLDSLLRGNAGRELAACLAAGAFTHAIVAPAFPYQNRATRQGRQWAPVGGEWRMTGEDIARTLRALGLGVTLAKPGERVPAGISIWDTESDADLAAIVAQGLEVDGRVLWSGSGGLAGALATPGAFGAGQSSVALEEPILGLFGTDHPVTVGQLSETGSAALRLPDGGPLAARRLAEKLAGDGVALVSLDLPTLSRGEAAARVAASFADLSRRIDRPATLIAGGGETLRALCDALGAEALDVTGRIVPGVPCSRIVGGRWNGVSVISKSGAFGDAKLLARLVVRLVSSPVEPALAAASGKS